MRELHRLLVGLKYDLLAVPVHPPWLRRVLLLPAGGAGWEELRIDWRPAAWIPPWLIGLGVISYLGQFPSSAPESGWAFQLVLQGKQTIPFWWDLVTVAVFSLVIYYTAARLAEPQEYVAQAVALADEEINLGDVTGGAAGATRAIPA